MFPDNGEVEFLDTEEALLDYNTLFNKYKEHFPDSNDDDIAAMVSIAVSVCHHCYNYFGTCYCMMDD